MLQTCVQCMIAFDDHLTFMILVDLSPFKSIQPLLVFQVDRIRLLYLSDLRMLLRITYYDHVVQLLLPLFHQLCTVPNRGVCKEAVGALLNLAINTKVRARIGFLGGIQVFLGKFICIDRYSVI